MKTKIVTVVLTIIAFCFLTNILDGKRLQAATLDEEELLSDSTPVQKIVILSVSTFSESANHFLFVGTGGAIVNDGSASYFWNSSTHPRISVGVNLDPRPSSIFQKLHSMVIDGVSRGKAIYIIGKGRFKTLQNQFPPSGIFDLDSVSQCDLISKDKINFEVINK